MQKVIHPQEIIVWNVMPFLRREIAFEMKNDGISQKKIAFLLSITEAAVSQYFNEKRAHNNVHVSPKLRSEINKSAKNIIKNKEKAMFEIQRLLKNKEVKNYMCVLHKKEFGAPRDCRICNI